MILINCRVTKKINRKERKERKKEEVFLGSHCSYCWF